MIRAHALFRAPLPSRVHATLRGSRGLGGTVGTTAAGCAGSVTAGASRIPEQRPQALEPADA
ncbi:hypothetical protein ACFWNT_27110 [Streptomyces sp. NPDC058409]|uniref:hypothetical protein n=1 Tax=Streptomyces sp. NPDC058409 TaxID=3346484 RepID=UPI00364AC630